MADYYSVLYTLRDWESGGLGIERLLSYFIGRDLKSTAKASVDAIVASLDDLVPWPASNAAMRRCAYRLSANKDRIRDGFPAEHAPLTVPTDWVIAQIVGIEQVRKPDREPRLAIAYRLLTGRLAGRQYRTEVKRTVARGIYGTLTGWPRKCSFETPKLLVGLQCVLSIGLYDQKLVSEHMGISKSLRAANVKLTRSRVRKLASCPHGSQLDCVLCPVGVNECDRSMQVTATQLLKGRNAHVR